MQEPSGSTDLGQWYVLDDFSQEHTNFNRAQIEWLYRKRFTNGFNKAFRKIGKRRYIHAGFFAECLIEQEG